MNPYLATLQTTLQRIDRAGDRTLAEVLGEWPETEYALSPWATWTLLCLVRHHARQQWVAETIQLQLGAELQALAAAGAFGHPSVPQTGLVPGLTEWEYYFHGRGCCLTHRITGESIDVDFYDETADWIDRYFFIRFLQSLRSPSPAEARLIALHRSVETVELSMQTLLDAELLLRHSEYGVVKLLPDCLELTPLIERLDAIWQDEQRRIIAAASLGDWLLVTEDSTPGDAVTEIVHARSDHCRQEYFDHLKTLYLSPDTSRLALEAMAVIEHPELDNLLEHALEGKPSGTTVTALKAIARRSGCRWCEPVFRLLRRVKPNGDLPQPRIWMMCAEYLLRNGYRAAEVCKLLRRLRRHELGEAALLTLEYAPELALDLFRRALRSEIPYNRLTAAAALAIIDSPWSHSELIAVLEDTDDQQATAECRAALMATHSIEAHRIVEDWERRNPHEPEPGPFITLDEMALRTRDETLQYEMESLHDRVLPLRTRVPSSPPRKWWWPFSRGDSA